MQEQVVPSAIVVRWEDRQPATDVWSAHELEFPVEQSETGEFWSPQALHFVADELWPEKERNLARYIHYRNVYREAE